MTARPRRMQETGRRQKNPVTPRTKEERELVRYFKMMTKAQQRAILRVAEALDACGRAR